MGMVLLYCWFAILNPGDDSQHCIILGHVYFILPAAHRAFMDTTGPTQGHAITIV